MTFFNVFAFGAGMVALINPCGFGLLPAYLGVFLGQKDESTSKWISLNRAQGVGLAMSLGMIVIFAFVGLALGGLEAIGRFLPYFNIALGFGLIILGVRMMRGYQLNLKLPKLNKGGGSGSFASMFLFGMSYATASLTCTLALFIVAINSANTTVAPGESTFIPRLGALVSYGIGMGLLATMLTLLLALGKTSIVGQFRNILPKINAFSGFLLLIVGPYSILYGIWELQVLMEPPIGTEGVMAWEWLNSFNLGVSNIQGTVSSWFGSEVTLFGQTTRRTNWLGWPFVIINVILIIGGFIARRRVSTQTPTDLPTNTNTDSVETAA